MMTAAMLLARAPTRFAGLQDVKDALRPNTVLRELADIAIRGLREQADQQALSDFDMSRVLRASRAAR